MEGGSFVGALKVTKGRLWGQESLFMGGLSWATWSGLIYRDFEIWLKGALEVECLYVGAL